MPASESSCGSSSVIIVFITLQNQSGAILDDNESSSFKKQYLRLSHHNVRSNACIWGFHVTYWEASANISWPSANNVYWRMQNNCTTSYRLERFVFQLCRFLLVVNVKEKYTQCKYATLYGYETVARWGAIILHTPVERDNLLFYTQRQRFLMTCSPTPV